MRTALLVTSALVSVVLASPAQAQESAAEEADEGGIAEIVVTAQRREESLQKAAVAVSAVTGDDLVKTGISDTLGLSRMVPSLAVTPTGGTTSFVLRGVGTLAANSFAENAVAFNFNGVYVGRPTAPIGSLYDLQRVEVVKGPQGTLYGRNATGGAINVLPNKPKLGELGGSLMLEYGNYDSKRGQAALNLPLGETVAVRLASQIVDRDGYLSDGYDDEKGEAFRASVLFEPSDDFSALLMADYFHQGGQGAGHVLIPTATFAAPALDARIGGADPIAANAIRAFASTLFAPPFCGGLGGFVTSGCIAIPGTNGFNDSTFWGVSATVEGDLGFGKLTVIPAYRRTESNYRMFLPGFQGEVTDEGDQMSLEVRLASNDDGRFRYVLGGYYFWEQQAADNYFNQGQLSNARFDPRLKTESIAAFGQFTFDVADTFRLVAGGRYTKEDKSQFTSVFTGGRPLPQTPAPPAAFTAAPFSGALSFNKFTWKAGVEWDAGPQSLVYANVSTGFKTGGFFVAAPPNNTFNPEELTAYTVGTKNRFFDNKLQLNLEAFYWDYKDQQITFVGGIRGSNGIFAQGGITVNAGQSRMYGAELDLVFAPTSNDLFSANVQYLDGKYNSLLTAAFSTTGAPVVTGCTVTGSRLANPGVNGARFYDTDCAGKPTINSPKWSANLAYEHTFDLGGDLALVAGARAQIQSSQFFNVNFIEAEKQGSYAMADAFLTLEGPDRKWSLTAFINNLTDETVLARTGTRPILNFSVATLRPPRTFGIRGTFNF
jgi:iron complex outermembrane receptor protein